MQKLLKLSFPTKSDWEKVKSTLTTEEGFIKGIEAIIELKHMQKPPAADFIPTGEDSGWTLDTNYSVDILISDFDYKELEEFLAPIPAKCKATIGGADVDIIIQKPSKSWSKENVIKYLSYRKIVYNKSDSKSKLLKLV